MSVLGYVDDIVSEESKTMVKKTPAVKRHNISRLAELSLIVDTGGAYKNEEGGEIAGLGRVN